MNKKRTGKSLKTDEFPNKPPQKADKEIDKLKNSDKSQLHGNDRNNLNRKRIETFDETRLSGRNIQEGNLQSVNKTRTTGSDSTTIKEVEELDYSDGRSEQDDGKDKVEQEKGKSEQRNTIKIKNNSKDTNSEEPRSHLTEVAKNGL